MSLALMNAVKANNLQEVKAILKDSEFDVNFRVKTPSIDGEITALHLAASNGYNDIVKELLAHPKIDANALTTLGRTALHAAATFGQIQTCEILIAEVLATIKDKTNKMAYDVAKERSSKVQLTEQGKFLKVIDILRMVTFLCACQSGNLELVKRMVDEQVNINAFYLNRSGLMVAAWNLQLHIIDYLLSLPQINVNAKLPSGDSILHLIFKPKGNKQLQTEFLGSDSSRKKIVKALIDKGADVNALNNDGSTPLFRAVVYDSLETVKALVENGADLNIIYEFNKNGAKLTKSIVEVSEGARPQIHCYLKDVKFNRGEYSFGETVKKLNSAMFTKKYTANTPDNPSHNIELTV